MMPRLNHGSQRRMRAIPSLILLSAGLAALPNARAAEPAAPKPSPWEETIRGFEQWDRKNSYPKDAVLFVGSSSIVRWATREHFPKLDVINRGFGGSRITDVNPFVDRIVLPYRPRVIVFYAGDNDIASGRNAGQVLDDYRTFVAHVHDKLPETQVIFIAIKPSRARWRLWPEMKAANERIERFSQTDARLWYADIVTPMLNDEGRPRNELLARDGLHLSEEGYRLWTRVIGPLIDDALREDEAASSRPAGRTDSK